MRRFGLILISSLLLFITAACSNNAGNGEAEQPGQTETGPRIQAPTKASGEQGKPAPGSISVKPDGSKKMIVFSTFYEEDFIKEAVKKYEALHPNITIQLTYAQAIGDDANWEANHEKFVKTMNAQMLTGIGPDLLEMDQLPIVQYVNKKVLLNLSDMMDNDPSFQREQYFTNILDNIKLGERVYGMPVGFSLLGITGNEAAIQKAAVTIEDKSWTWNQFIQTSKELTRKGELQSAMLGVPEYLLDQMVHYDYSTFVDQANRKANFDSAAFTGLLQQVKTMLDDKILKRVDGMLFASPVYMKAYFTMDTVGSFRRFVLDDTDQLKFYNKPLAEGQKPGGFFSAGTMLSINAKSAVKNEAWDFVKFLISDEVDPGGFPLNKNVYKKQEQQILQQGTVNADEEGPEHGKPYKVHAADLQRLDEYVNAAVHFVGFEDSKIEEIILEEAKAFFNGQKSAEAVAKLIQNRVTLVLDE